MQDKKRKIFTPQMLKFEMLNVLCNPYTHIFGVGLPILLAMLITKVAVSQLPAEELHPMVATSVYLGMGTLIPMAVLLMGYAVSYAQSCPRGYRSGCIYLGLKTVCYFITGRLCS